MLHTRFLIVGQGIAGTMLAYALIRRGLTERTDFLLVDAGLEYSSSRVSTGVLNPVIFKRMTLSWGSEFLPLAWDLYKDLELFLNEQVADVCFLHCAELFHLFLNETDSRHWDESSPAVQSFLGHRFSTGGFVLGSGWIDALPLLTSFRKYLIARDQLIDEHFRVGELDSSEGLWQGISGNITFDKLILCTGVQYRYFFNYDLPDQLPFYPVKGDLLTLRLSLHEKFPCEAIIAYRVMLQPIHGGLFRAGSSYLRDFVDVTPSHMERRWILSELNAMGVGEIAELEQAVISQDTGIRPTSPNRLAYLGELGNSERLIVFNGLGTRGFMLAPALAVKLVDWLLDGSPLPAELLISPQRLCP